MIKDELEVVNSFIRHNCLGQCYEREVPLGKSLAGNEWKELMRKYQGISKVLEKKIDILIYTNMLHIVECKTRMSMQQLGQLLTYKFIYNREHNMGNQEIELIAACKYVDEILIDVFKAYNVKIWAIGRGYI